jgi:hypothetical protein
MTRLPVLAAFAAMLSTGGVASARADDQVYALAGARNAQTFAAALIFALVSGNAARGQPLLAAEAASPPETAARASSNENPALLERAGHRSPVLGEDALVQQE